MSYNLNTPTIFNLVLRPFLIISLVIASFNIALVSAQNTQNTQSLNLSTDANSFNADSFSNLKTDGFIIKDIRVEGLQRVSLGRVLNQMPFSIGDEFSPNDASEVVTSLYELDIFEEVIVSQDEDVLVVSLIERPIIYAIDIEGNSKISKETIEENLGVLGIEVAKVSQPALLKRAENNILNAYQTLGYYKTRVEIQQIPESRNRVVLNISIVENPPARIQAINFIGNHSFDEEDLKSLMALKESNLFSSFTKRDVYSQQILAADLERLRSFYFNQGFADFLIISSDLELSIDQEHITLNIDMKEGERYVFGLSGFDPSNDEFDLTQLISYAEKERYDFSQVQKTINNLSVYYADQGYAFAEFEPQVDLDKDNFTAI